MTYDWPGNIRELRNVVERAMILGDGQNITLNELPPQIKGEILEPLNISNLREALRAYESTFIRNALMDYGWNKEQTARRLGVNSSTLYRKISDLGINNPPSKKK